jgi:hypothetical protein
LRVVTELKLPIELTGSIELRHIQDEELIMLEDVFELAT